MTQKSMGSATNKMDDISFCAIVVTLGPGTRIEMYWFFFYLEYVHICLKLSNTSITTGRT